MKKILNRIHIKFASFGFVFMAIILGTIIVAGAAGTTVYCSKFLCVKKLNTEIVSTTISDSVPGYGGQNAVDLACDNSERTYSSQLNHFLVAYCPEYTLGSSHDFFIFPFEHKFTFKGYTALMNNEPFYDSSYSVYSSGDGMRLRSNPNYYERSSISSNANYHFKIYECTGGYQTGYSNVIALSGDDISTSAYSTLAGSYESTGCGAQIYVAERHDADSVTYEHNYKGSLHGGVMPADDDFDWYADSITPVDYIDDDGNIVKAAFFNAIGTYFPPKYSCTRVINCETCGLENWKEYSAPGLAVYYCKSNDELTHRQYSACATCGYVYHDYNEEHTFKNNNDYSALDENNHTYTMTCSGQGFATYTKSEDYWDRYIFNMFSTSENERCGYTKTVTEEHNWEYTYKVVDDETHSYTRKCKDCGYEDPTTYIESHCDDNNDNLCDKCNYAFAIFSVTVPTTLSINMDKDGNIYTADNLKIQNNSSDAVEVKEINLEAADGWAIVSYDTNMANEKVDSKKIGLKICDSVTDDLSQMEMTGDLTIDKGESLNLTYDAVVSATSVAITDEEIMTVTFVIDWSDG